MISNKVSKLYLMCRSGTRKLNFLNFKAMSFGIPPSFFFYFLANKCYQLVLRCSLRFFVVVHMI